MSAEPETTQERGMTISAAQRATAGTDRIVKQNPHTMEIAVTDGNRPRVIDFAGKTVGGSMRRRAPRARS
jgi:hypothetical protein